MDRVDVCSVFRDSSPLVLVNPLAGGNKARRYLPQIRALFESLKIPAQFALTRSPSELESAARRAVSQNQRLLLAMGGDGTFQALANAVFGTDVIVGLLPVGGGNDFAAALGMPVHPVRAAEAVLRGKPRHVDLVRAHTADGHERLYVGGGGIGLDVEAARYASGSFRHLPGRVRYIASALRALAGYTPPDVRMEFPGSEQSAITVKALLAAILKTPTYGAGLRLAPEATVDDGLLHVVLIENLSTVEVLKLLPRLTVSGELRTPHVKRWRVQRVRLTTDRPSLFHGDGEILGPTPADIEVVPRAVRVLAPPMT